MDDPVTTLILAARAWRQPIDAATLGQWADDADLNLFAAVDQLDASGYQPGSNLDVLAEYTAGRCGTCGYLGTTGEHRGCPATLTPVRLLVVAGAGDA